MKKYLVELSAFIFQNVFDYFDSVSAQNLDSFPCNSRVWITGTNDDPCDA